MSPLINEAMFAAAAVVSSGVFEMLSWLNKSSKTLMDCLFSCFAAAAETGSAAEGILKFLRGFYLNSDVIRTVEEPERGDGYQRREK